MHYHIEASQSMRQGGSEGQSAPSAVLFALLIQGAFDTAFMTRCVRKALPVIRYGAGGAGGGQGGAEQTGGVNT